MRMFNKFRTINEIACISISSIAHSIRGETKKTKLRGLSPRANYTDRAAADFRRS
jgi:hypothetical protein